MLARIKAVAQRYRIAIFVVALAVFLGGVGFAIQEAAIDPDQVEVGTFLVIMLIFSPLTVFLSALQLHYAAVALAQTLPLLPALRITAVAMASNMLPLPGAYLVRTHALAPDGSLVALKRAATLNLLTAKQWIALSALAFAVALVGILPWLITVPVLLAGVAGLLLTVVLWRKSRFPMRSFVIALAILAVMIGVEIVRILLAFSALGASVDLYQATALSIAGVIGSVVGIVPAGLGIRELSAAGIALLVGVDPELAFAATALNRIAGLVVLAVAGGGITWRAARNAH